MKITNLHGLPDAIYEAVKNDPYDPGESDITVTGLISPPLQGVLIRDHYNEITEDASDRLWALMGTAVHSVLERAEPSALTEQRLYADCLGWKVGGKFDTLSLNGKVLGDYKFSSIYEVIYGLKPEREQQMNLLAELCIRNGHPVEKLFINHIARDWQKSKAKMDYTYPQKQCNSFPVKLWPKEEREAFLEKRVSLHQQAREGKPSYCTDEDRWYTGDKWAVMKKGNKKATKLFNKEIDANAFILEHKEKAKLSVVFRQGAYKRCDDYCSVKAFCPNYKEAE